MRNSKIYIGYRLLKQIMVTIQKTSHNQLIITIPKIIAEFKQLDKGTKVIFKEHTKNTLLLEIVRDSDKE